MKTLDEHNKESMKSWFLQPDKKADVACPKCGTEMEYMNPNLQNMSNPPSYTVICKCGYIGYKY